MMKQNKAAQRLEQTVRDKLDKGWNAFTREEVEALIEIIASSRRAKRTLYQRIHTSHGDALGWTFEGDVALHHDRPAPVGAINLFVKPRGLAFNPGWRIPKGCRIRGFVRTPEGEIFMRNRKAASPNDVMRVLHSALEDLSSAYKVYEVLCSESEESA